MLHLVRRHPFPVKAHLRQCLAITYAFPEKMLEGLLPPGLVLDSYAGFGFVAVALVETERLRPAFLPAAVGQDFFLCGYRIFVRLRSRESARRGLYILRSDTDRASMAKLGNWFTHYRYHVCQVSCSTTTHHLRWTIKSPELNAELAVTADLSRTIEQPPSGSPFPDLKTARRFAGPLPYTFDYEPETDSIISVLGVRSSWAARPVEVSVERAGYFRREPFSKEKPILANAFYVENVPYRWQRGRKLVVPE